MIRFLPLRASEDDCFHTSIARHSGDRVLSYKEVHGQKLLLSLYEPSEYGAERLYPLLVLVHGGGWQGRKVFADQADWAGDYLGFLARRYAEKGWLCACIDYRLMRENGQAAGYELIDLYEDCTDATAWLKNHAAELRIDLARTAVLGESAGGYLAAALITLPMGDVSFYKSAILVNAITDLSDMRWGERVAARSAHPLLKEKSEAEKIALLSPTAHITAQTCPTLMLHGEQDSVVFPFHSVKFHDLLNACNVETELDFIQDTNHAFLLAEYMQENHVSLQAAVTAAAQIDAWLDKQGTKEEAGEG